MIHPRLRLALPSLLILAALVLIPGNTATAHTDAVPLPAGLQIVPIATDLAFVSDIAIAPDGRIFYIDSSLKQVRVLDRSGELLYSIPIPTINPRPSMILGFALDPNYEINSTLYVHYLDRQTWSNHVIRFQHQQSATSNVVLLLNIPLPTNPINPDQPCTDHNGGHLAFADDGYLLVPMGENCYGNLAQDLTKLQGKVLRINPVNGLTAPGNPFADGSGPNQDRIWALGLRNPFGIAIDPVTGIPWASDNGPGCGDEVNRIVAGGNYGWPVSSPSYNQCIDPGDEYQPPEHSWAKTIAPTGLTFFDGDLYEPWQNSLLVCSWNNGNLYRLSLDAERQHVVGEEIVDLGLGECRLDIEVGPDGNVYLAGQNTIYRIDRPNMWLPLIMDS